MSSAQAERLETLLRSPAAADKGEIRTVLIRLSAEIKERSKRISPASLDFFTSALKALSKLKGASDYDVRLECLVECVEYFYFDGHQSMALEAARQVVTLAGLAKDQTWIRKGHNYTAIIHADQGQVGEALLHYSRALELSVQLGDIVGQVKVLSNMGVALNYAGLYREAIPCFQRATRLSDSLDGERNLVATCQTNLAQSHLYLEEFDDGFTAAERALTGLPEPVGPADTVSYAVRVVTYVQLALELGKLRAARDLTSSCVQLARRVDSPRANTLAEVARGMCEVHGGSSERGLRILEEVLERTTVHSCKPLILVALVKAYDITNQPEKALIHMRSLLDRAKETRGKAIATLVAEGWRDEKGSLRALELREARLEARIAERQIAIERAQMLERLAVTADLREEESGKHGYRVGRLAGLCALQLGWTTESADALESSARLHDIGKIAIPDRILLTSAELQQAERRFMSTHTSVGAELLARGNSPELRIAEEIARHHHEWWNGEGYPSKLKGKRIPIHARIVAIADVFDALTHGRPFSPPWAIDKAIGEIKARKGTQFDPEITDVFLELIAKLRTEHPDLDEYLGRAGRNSPFLQARNRIREMLAEEREHEKMATVGGNETRH